MTLVDFLHARIAEDERSSRSGQLDVIPSDCWDPDRVLVECETKRQIIKDAVDYRPEPFHVAPDARRVWPRVLCLLALPYADHPDFDERWRP